MTLPKVFKYTIGDTMVTFYWLVSDSLLGNLDMLFFFHARLFHSFGYIHANNIFNVIERIGCTKTLFLYIVQYITLVKLFFNIKHAFLKPQS